jgi:predicted TIM-barrel fold metal-dependent hydrolase
MEMLVDSHGHVIAADQDRYPLAPASMASVPGVPGGWHRKLPVSVQGLSEAMAGAGVSKAVLVQAISVYGEDSSYAADSARDDPGSFTSVGMIDISKDGAVDRLDYWMTERGMRGFRLPIAGLEPGAINGPAAAPVWRRAADLGAPVCLMLRASQLHELRDVLDRVPELTVVLEHLGGLPVEGGDGAAVVASYPNVRLKLSMLNLDSEALGGAESEDALRRLVDTFGAQRLMWSSNYPTSQDRPYAAMVDLARQRAAFLTEGDQRWLFSETALAVWPELRD